MSKQPWKGTEKVFVRENYRLHGAVWCAERLGRTEMSVRMFALKNGFADSEKTQRAQSSPQADDLIRRIYETERVRRATKAAKALGRTPQWVCRRAAELGLTGRFSDPRPYSKEEAAFVETNAHLSRAYIAAKMRKRGWRRTAASIQKFISYHRLQDNGCFHSAESLSLCLGVGTNAIWRWALNGLLIGERRDAPEAASNRLVFDEAEVARFIVQHPHRIDMRKVDGPWLIDLLARLGAASLVEGRSKSERIVALKQANPDLSPAQLAAVFDTTADSVSVILSRAKSAETKKAA